MTLTVVFRYEVGWGRLAGFGGVARPPLIGEMDESDAWIDRENVTFRPPLDTDWIRWEARAPVVASTAEGP